MPTLSLGVVLGRGALAGVLAGLAAGLVSLFVVEPRIRAALAIEEARSGGHGHEEVFNRTTQVIGGVVAVVLVAVCLAVVLALVFARTRHRLAPGTDFGRVMLLAAAGFVAVALLPAVKYPANPPGVGVPETVATRTAQFFSFVAIGVAVVWLGFLLHASLSARGWATPYRAVTGVGVVVAAYVVLLLVWPASPDAVPADVPAGLLWEFRLASIAELATLWTVLGVAFGLLLSPRPALLARRAAAPAAR